MKGNIMPKITIDLPDAIDFKHDGKAFTATVDNIHETNLAPIFVYGLRRKIQDTLNGARAASDDPTAWDGKAQAEGYLGKLATADFVGSRGGGGGDGRPAWFGEVVKMLRPALKARDAAAYKAMAEKDRLAAIGAMFDGAGPDQQAALEKTAKARIKQAEKEAAEAAELAKGLGL